MTDNLPESRFRVDASKCTGCGLCAADCPAHIIEMRGETAAMDPKNDGECLACQHCLAICPAGAVEVGGRKPGGSMPVEKTDPRAVERVIFARRSVRGFTPEPVPPETIRRIIDTVNHAPTAVNIRDLHFHVVTNAEAMRDLRKRSCERLVAMGDLIPEDRRWIAAVAKNWLDGGPDGIFRDAPHIVVVTGGPEQIHTRVDSVIALSYFDLYASAQDIGTTWCGMFDTVLRSVPESRSWLGIPADHEIGYAMLFGNAAVTYARSAQHAPASLNLVKGLK